MTQIVFDGHNDVLSQLARSGDPTRFGTGLPGHLDVPKARAGGFGGGFFAIWCRSELSLAAMEEATRDTPYDLELPEPLDRADAWGMAREQADILLGLHQAGHVALCTSVAEIGAARDAGRIAAIMHLEGAEPIGPDLTGLDALHAMGLRSLGPVWSRPNIFGHGVPFRFPSDGDTGPGLSECGRALVARCNALRILIDLSHLTAKGVEDVAQISDAPLVATHSNPHAVAPHARNLTDAQLRLIAGSGGVVGLNFETTFLRPDGLSLPDLPAALVMRHLDHLLMHLGEEGVALGSDYDGCRPPLWLNSSDKLPALIAAMSAHGYSDARIERICWDNWMRVLRDTWGD